MTHPSRVPSRLFTTPIAVAIILFASARTSRAQEAAPDEGSVAPPPKSTATTDPERELPQGAALDVRETAVDEASAATQVASFAVTQLKDSPAVVTVISADDIRSSGARDLIDILHLVPGYFMGLDTQGVVGPGFRGLWGHEGKILLMIDGKEMNELLFSSMQLGNEFPVELIERVEIVRGPGSVIYGGSAELSVINVITRGLQGSSDVAATATYGQMTNAPHLGTGYARRKLTLSGRYVSEAVPGLSSFLSLSLGQGQRSVRTFVDNSGMVATMEDQSALNPTLIHAGVGYRDIQATFLYHRMATTNITGFGQVLGAPVPNNFDAYHGELVATFRPGDRVEIIPRFNLTYQTPWNEPNSASDFYYNKSVRRLRGRLLGRWAALDQLQVTAGGDAVFDEAWLLSPPGAVGLQTQFGDADRISYQTYGGYMELFSENPIVNVAAGARYDHQSTVGGALVPRLVLLRSFGPVSLKGLFSMSFRAPGVENLNTAPRVRSEKTRIFEFEAAIDITAQQRFSANVYDLAIQAPIAYIVTEDPATMMPVEGYINLGRQGTRGFEVTYRLRMPVVKVEANYSFYAPSVANNTPAYDVPGHGEQFLAAAAHRGSLRGTVRPVEWLGITPSAVVVGPRFTKGPPDAGGVDTASEIPVQLLANLFVYSNNVGIRGLTVGLGFYNILGTKYRFVRASSSSGYADDHAPLPGLDREVMLRLSYFFEPS